LEREELSRAIITAGYKEDVFVVGYYIIDRREVDSVLYPYWAIFQGVHVSEVPDLKVAILSPGYQHLVVFVCRYCFDVGMMHVEEYKMYHFWSEIVQVRHLIHLAVVLIIELQKFVLFVQ